MSTLGKRVYRLPVPWVRIPSLPPLYLAKFYNLTYFSMTNENSYENFLDGLKEALIEKDTTKLDNVLQTMHGGWLEQDELDDLEEIISEATLYLELKDEEYREMALVLIREREEE